MYVYMYLVFVLIEIYIHSVCKIIQNRLNKKIKPLVSLYFTKHIFLNIFYRKRHKSKFPMF